VQAALSGFRHVKPCDIFQKRGRAGASLGEFTSCTQPCLVIRSSLLVGLWQSGSAPAAKLVALPALTPAIAAENDIHSRVVRGCSWGWWLEILWLWLILLLILLWLLRGCFLSFLPLGLPPNSFFLSFEFFGSTPILVPPPLLVVSPAGVPFSFSTLILELHSLLALRLALRPPLCPGPRHAVDDCGAQKRTAPEHFSTGLR